MPIRARKLLIAACVVAFLVQTALVYSDRTGWSMRPLTPLAQEGRQLWHQYNCQSCHQLYGFGGFLGPDLTNAARRMSAQRVEQILTRGSKQMPAFDFDAKQRQAMMQFLEEVNRTGLGEPRRTPRKDPNGLLDRVVATRHGVAPLTPLQQRGHRVMVEQKCLSCHRPNRSAVGPDLLTMLERRKPEEIHKILILGTRRGMPALRLKEADRKAVLAFLEWLGKNREAVDRPFAELKKQEGGLPWFEYTR